MTQDASNALNKRIYYFTDIEVYKNDLTNYLSNHKFNLYNDDNSFLNEYFNYKNKNKISENVLNILNEVKVIGNFEIQ